MRSNEYTVIGMHCSHCSTSITESVGRIDAVDDIQVDVSTGSLRFTSRTPVDADEVRTALEDAGYELESA